MDGFPYIGSDLEINNKILMFPLLDYTSARQVICPKFYTARFWGQKLNTLIARKLRLFSLTIHRCKIYTVNALISVFWVVHTSCLSKTITAAGGVKKFSQVQNFPIGTQKTLYTQHKILHQFCRSITFVADFRFFKCKIVNAYMCVNFLAWNFHEVWSFYVKFHWMCRTYSSENNDT